MALAMPGEGTAHMSKFLTVVAVTAAAVFVTQVILALGAMTALALAASKDREL